MFDGFKILCVGTNYLDWENNPLLSFVIEVVERTGEIRSGRKVAEYRGLRFQIISSTKSNFKHCIIQGSFARYYNYGGDNAFDFNYSMMQDVIEDLMNIFNVFPDKAKLQTLEFGVNVFTEKSPIEITRGLRAYSNSTFEEIESEGKSNGRQLKRDNWKYKVYDKSYVICGKQTNLLRVELAMDSIKEIRVYGIGVLGDLKDMDKINKLEIRLIKIWQEIIFHDKGMQYRKMTTKQKQKMLLYLDATNWVKFTPKQRSRAKIYFRELCDKFCTSTTQADILLSIEKKLKKLTTENGHVLRNFCNTKELENMSRFTYLDKEIKSDTNCQGNLNEKCRRKSVKKKHRKCCVCKASISSKRSGAKFCSLKCKNSYHSRKRTKNRKAKREVEERNLNKLFKMISKNQFYYYISYQYKDISYSNRLLCPIKVIKEIIQGIVSVDVRKREGGEVFMSFTTVRAKKLMKYVSLYRLQKEKGTVK